MDNLRSLPAATLAIFFFGNFTFAEAQQTLQNIKSSFSNVLTINVLDCEKPTETIPTAAILPTEKLTERESPAKAQPLDFQLFPNPCLDFANVVPTTFFPPETQLLLTDSKGAGIRWLALAPDGQRLDLSHLPAGNYFLTVIPNAGEAKSKALVKQNGL